MINSQINTLLKSSSRYFVNKSLLNNTNSNKLINQIAKQFFKKNQNRFLFNKKSFCEKHQINKNSENLEQNSTSNKINEEFISFGFKTVKKDERQDLVNSVFANVAKR
jgi:hypothetical protein